MKCDVIKLRTQALNLCFTVLKTAELFEITQDQSWSDPSWAAKEASIPALLKELTVSPALCSNKKHFNANNPNLPFLFIF